MENLFKVVLLAVIQGITEFLPVSSSGHLVLMKHFLEVNTAAGATMEIVLHGGTLASIFVFYRRHLARLLSGVFCCEKESIRIVLLLLVGFFPACVLALTARSRLEAAFMSPQFVSYSLMVTGLFLLLGHYAKPGWKRVGWRSGLMIGLAQAVALLPGISRSGLTIGTARFLRIEPKKAAEYSFLISIPLLAGASLQTLSSFFRGDNMPGNSVLELALGFLVSGWVGYFSLQWLVSLLRRGQFWWFGLYCLALGCLSFALLFG